MADTAVAITAGTGTNIDTRTEATNGNHRQVVVIGDPTLNAGVATVLDASTAPQATDPALVVAISPNSVNANGQATMANSAPVVIASNQSALPVTDNSGSLTVDNAGTFAVQATAVASEVHVGEVGGKTQVFAVALSTDTSAYASGDLIADTQQMDAFFRKADGTGVINSITIIDQDAQGVALYVLFMSTSTSLGTENSAPNISDANLTTGLQGIVAVATTDYVTVSGTKVATIKNIGLPVKAVSGTDDLYIAVLNSTGTPTYTATGLNMKIQALLD